MLDRDWSRLSYQLLCLRCLLTNSNWLCCFNGSSGHLCLDICLLVANSIGLSWSKLLWWYTTDRLHSHSNAIFWLPLIRKEVFLNLNGIYRVFIIVKRADVVIRCHILHKELGSHGVVRDVRDWLVYGKSTLLVWRLLALVSGFTQFWSVLTLSCQALEIHCLVRGLVPDRTNSILWLTNWMLNIVGVCAHSSSLNMKCLGSIIQKLRWQNALAASAGACSPVWHPLGFMSSLALLPVFLQVCQVLRAFCWVVVLFAVVGLGRVSLGEALPRKIISACSRCRTLETSGWQSWRLIGCSLVDQIIAWIFIHFFKTIIFFRIIILIW